MGKKEGKGEFQEKMIKVASLYLGLAIKQPSKNKIFTVTVLMELTIRW